MVDAHVKKKKKTKGGEMKKRGDKSKTPPCYAVEKRYRNSTKK